MIDLPWWPVLVFWSSLVVALLVSGLGVARRHSSLLIGGAISMLPASLYLAATPQFHYVACIPALCLLLAGYALRRNRVWIGGSLVAVAVIFWSVVGSMLAFPILLHVIVAGAAIGLVGAHGPGRKTMLYIGVGIIGAFVGAFLGFGDTPLFMRAPHLNSWTLSVVAAVLFTAALWIVDETVLGG